MKEHTDETIKVIIDVGVYTGTPDLIERYPNSNEVHMVDPLDVEKNVDRDNLDNKNLFFYNCAVGSENTTLDIHYTKSSDAMASLCDRTPYTLGTRKEKTVKVDVKRLDDLFPSVPKETVLKLDVEGYELEALKGAKNLIKNITYIESEITSPGVGRFYNSYHFDDIFKFMYANNYSTDAILVVEHRICNVRFKNND